MFISATNNYYKIIMAPEKSQITKRRYKSTLPNHNLVLNNPGCDKNPEWIHSIGQTPTTEPRANRNNP